MLREVALTRWRQVHNKYSAWNPNLIFKQRPMMQSAFGSSYSKGRIRNMYRQDIHTIRNSPGCWNIIRSKRLENGDNCKCISFREGNNLHSNEHRKVSESETRTNPT